MRVIVLFDLPMETAYEKKSYTRFRKFLLKEGFMMLQKSVYTKLVLNLTAANVVMHNVRSNKPPKGLVQMITITEKQYTRMECVMGESKSDTINTTERLVVF